MNKDKIADRFHFHPRIDKGRELDKQVWAFWEVEISKKVVVDEQ